MSDQKDLSLFYPLSLLMPSPLVLTSSALVVLTSSQEETDDRPLPPHQMSTWSINSSYTVALLGLSLFLELPIFHRLVPFHGNMYGPALPGLEPLGTDSTPFSTLPRRTGLKAFLCDILPTFVHVRIFLLSWLELALTLSPSSSSLPLISFLFGRVLDKFSLPVL